MTLVFSLSSRLAHWNQSEPGKPRCMTNTVVTSSTKLSTLTATTIGSAQHVCGNRHPQRRARVEQSDQMSVPSVSGQPGHH